MKLIPSSLLIAMFSINTLLYAQTLSVESNDVMAQELKTKCQMGYESNWILDKYRSNRYRRNWKMEIAVSKFSW